MIDISDIKASIQSGTLIQDKFFKKAEFLKDSRGRLVSYTGGFTVVVPAFIEGEKWAFRCWHVPVKDAKERYSCISSGIRNSKLPYFCSFDYEENGLLVKGETLPITKMKWVNGQKLKEYICANYQESSKIKALAKTFLDMVVQLHSSKISHGDLQHGNIIVSDLGKIYLVDYDSMYVPEMGNKFSDVITGLVDYQHPNRKQNEKSFEKLDYFSEVIIYTSLLGIAERAELVEKYKIEGSESLLFKSKDYEDFTNSQIYQDLKSINSDEIDLCLNIITSYLSCNDINDLEPIETHLISIEVDCPLVVPVGEPFFIKWTTQRVNYIEVSGLGKLPVNGEKELKLLKNTDLTFIISSETGFKTKKNISIRVANRVAINYFKADKDFTIESVPVKISWVCTNAKKVEIVGFGEQESIGHIIVTPKEKTIYTLIVEDDFGEYKRELKVAMLPIPVIETLLVETPQIKSVINIQVPELAIRTIPSIPNIKLDFAKLVVERIPKHKNIGNIINISYSQKSNLSSLISGIIKRCLKLNNIKQLWMRINTFSSK